MSKPVLSDPITLRLPLDVLADIEAVAKATERTRSWIMVRAMRYYLLNEGRIFWRLPKVSRMSGTARCMISTQSWPSWNGLPKKTPLDEDPVFRQGAGLPQIGAGLSRSFRQACCTGNRLANPQGNGDYCSLSASGASRANDARCATVRLRTVHSGLCRDGHRDHHRRHQTRKADPALAGSE